MISEDVLNSALRELFEVSPVPFSISTTDYNSRYIKVNPAYLRLVGQTALLSLTMLSVGFLVSAFSRRAGVAIGVGLFLWLAFVFLGDLGLMGTAIVLRLEPGTLLAITILNPLESYRIAAIFFLRGSLELLGPAGLVAERRFGDRTGLVLIGVLLLWLLAPLGLAYRAMGREVRR